MPPRVDAEAQRKNHYVSMLFSGVTTALLNNIRINQQ
jgi:hypothetical protein